MPSRLLTLMRKRGGSTPLLLDTVTGAVAAYSLRKLRAAYSGSAIRVRRSSDNAEQDIGFVSGVLDTASLLTFCGAGNGFVATWYDQSGSGNNATNATALSQPQIVSSGSVLMVSGKPTLFFSNTDLIVGALTNYTNFCWCEVQQTTNLSASAAQYLFGTSTTAGFIYGGFNTAFNGFSFYNGGASSIKSTHTPDTNRHVLIESIVSGTVYFYVDGSAAGSALVTSNGNSQPTFGAVALGLRSSQPALRGPHNKQEVILFSGDKSGSIDDIESNINTYYSIY